MKCFLTNQREASMIQLVLLKATSVILQRIIQNNLKNMPKIIRLADGDHLHQKNEKYCKWWEEIKNNIWDNTNVSLSITKSTEEIDPNKKKWKTSISVDITKMPIDTRDNRIIVDKEEIEIAIKEIIIMNGSIDRKTQFLQASEMP